MTPAGHAEVQRLRAARAQRARRAVAAQEAFLDWLYDDEHGPDPTHMPIPDSFAGEVRAHFYGDPLDVPMIERAAASLQERGCIDGPGAWGATGPLRVRLLDEGRKVVERGGILNPPATERPVYQTGSSEFSVGE